MMAVMLPRAESLRARPLTGGATAVAKRVSKAERLKQFLAEAEDILGSMGKSLSRLEKGIKAGVIDPSDLNTIFRSAHSLKGVSGLYEMSEMTMLAHSIEDALDLLRMGRISLTYEVLDCIIRGHELLVRIISSKGKSSFAGEIERLVADLSASYEARKQTERRSIDKDLLSVLTEYEEHRLRENLRESRNVFLINVRFPLTSFDKGYAELTEVLKSEGEVIATLPSSRTTPETLHFDILMGTGLDSDSVLALIGGMAVAEIRVLAEQTGPAPAVVEQEGPDRAGAENRGESLRRVSNTVRVDINKLDYIMSIVSELGALKSGVARLSAELKNEREFSPYGIELSRVEKQLERKLAELRDGMLDVRMVPIGHLFGRFEPFLNRVSREAGKEIVMTTHGGETELDKLIAEDLADPLMHIIRNAVDHAIEPPEVREANGKPRTGTITLGAFHKGNHIVLEVHDDGAGIDEESIREMAVSKGIGSPDHISGLSRNDIIELIFKPGFTTREVVTETSGRGVGMDVVRENITRLGGIIDIETVKGEGTSFILTIPITLAIVRALIVEDASRKYAVPLNSVIEVVDLSASESGPLKGLDYVAASDRRVPAVSLSSFFGINAEPAETAYGIVAGLAEHRLCIIVDALVEELDVVTKPLPRILDVPGIAGATDMGEKGTILVLDITGIMEQVMTGKRPRLKTGS